MAEDDEPIRAHARTLWNGQRSNDQTFAAQAGEKPDITTGECVVCERWCLISTHTRMCKGCTIAAQIAESE